MPRLRHISSSQYQAGFTLIELLVVLSITVLLMMTVSIFFMTFVVGNTKAVFEQKLKQDIFGFSANVVMAKYTTLILSYEGTFEPNKKYHRYFITAIQRFKNK